MDISEVLKEIYTVPIIQNIFPPEVAKEMVLDIEEGPRYGPWRSDRHISHNPKRWANPGLDLKRVLDPTL